LLEAVDKMADGHYDYDVVTYRVVTELRGRRYPVAYPSWYASWYDPFWFSCYACGPAFFGPRFGFSTVVVVGRPAFRGRRR